MHAAQRQGGGLSAFYPKSFVGAQASAQLLNPLDAIPAEETLLVPSVSQFDLGTLPRAGRKSVNFQLRNLGAATVEVAHLQVSCECLRVELEKRALGPGEETQASATVDFSGEPGYSGSLLLDATGSAKGSPGPAFVVTMNVTVQ